MIPLNKLRLVPRLATNIQSVARMNMIHNPFYIARDPDRTLGEWPATPQERAAAAKKYNLIPEDYMPHDYDEAFGDYPRLKAYGDMNKDPYDDYDDVTFMRHTGEPLHVHQDMYKWDGIDPFLEQKPGYLSWGKRALIFFSIVAFLPVGEYLSNKYDLRPNKRWKIRRFLPADTVYYEFPPSEADIDYYHSHH